MTPENVISILSAFDANREHREDFSLLDRLEYLHGRLENYAETLECLLADPDFKLEAFIPEVQKAFDGLCLHLETIEDDIEAVRKRLPKEAPEYEKD